MSTSWLISSEWAQFFPLWPGSITTVAPASGAATAAVVVGESVVEVGEVVVGAVVVEAGIGSGDDGTGRLVTEGDEGLSGAGGAGTPEQPAMTTIARRWATVENGHAGRALRCWW
ncbi:hypothetical protein BH23ACT5_BH23ACT5_10120 [soil metagenome]